MNDTASTPASASLAGSKKSSETENGSQYHKVKHHRWPAMFRRQNHHEATSFAHPLRDEKFGAPYLVDFDGPNDPYHPLNWPGHKKRLTLGLYSIIALASAFNSAIFESAVFQISSGYDVSTTVASLGTSLTLVGFAFGPLLWAPMSELYGRKWVILGPFFIAACFAFAAGSSKDIQSILITRFFQGFFSSSVLANMAAMLADIYSPKQRAAALVIFSLSVIGGPLTSPIVGAAIVNSYLRWRWTMFIVGILQMVSAVLAILFVEETYPAVLLARKAAKLRHTTGNWALHTKHEESDLSFRQLARKYLVRPFLLLANPICFLMSLYASFVYALIYGSLAAIPLIFQVHRGWTPVVASLPFLALLIGCFIGLILAALNAKSYAKTLVKNGGKPVPEARLYSMIFGGFFLVAGLFTLAWTGQNDVPWIAPCIGIACIGVGYFPIFQASTNYLVDAFLPWAASALATVTFMRSLLAAAFPLFTAPMLNSLGIGWGVSLLGFIAVAMLPIPYLFLVYGKRLRERARALEI